MRLEKDTGGKEMDATEATSFGAEWLKRMRAVRVVDTTYYHDLAQLQKPKEPQRIQCSGVRQTTHQYLNDAQRWHRGHKTKRTTPLN
jgi:hypothetical protein